MSPPDTDRVETLLSRRHQLLERLRSGPVTKPSLVEELPVSRSTVDRAVRELEELSLVERAQDGVSLTLSGRLALDSYDQFREEVEAVALTAEALSGLDENVTFDPVLLHDATVVGPVPHEPNRPGEHLLELIEEADHVYTYSTAFIPDLADAYYDSIVSDGMEAEVILTGEVIDRIVRDRSEDVEEALDHGLELYRAEADDAPYSLLLATTPSGPTVGVLVNGENGISGFIRTQAPEAVQWARSRLDDVRRRADPLSA